MKLVFLTVTALLFTVMTKLGHHDKPRKVRELTPIAQLQIRQ